MTMSNMELRNTTATAGEMSPVLDEVKAQMADGAVIHIRRMSSHPTRRLFMSHGNGLAIDGFRTFWTHLLPDAEVVVFDFRNHGRNSTAPRLSENNWVRFVKDFDEVLHLIESQFGRKQTFGAFHSMSALTSLLHASNLPHPWKGLVLFEPPAVPPEGRPERKQTLDLHDDLSIRTRKRRTQFESPEQLSRSFSRLLMFQRMGDAARLQLAAATLRQQSDGTFVLACPPDFEADTFKIGDMAPHWHGFARINCPVHIVSSSPDDSDMPVVSSISRLLAADFGFRHTELSDCGHLVMLDKPELCAGLVRGFIRELDHA